MRGVPILLAEKFNMKVLQQGLEKVVNNGCEFYVTPFPQEDYGTTMQQFARDVIPSYVLSA